MKLGLIVAIAPLVVLAACGGETPAENQAAAETAVPDVFPTGEWEAVATVETLGSTDKTTPATDVKVGDAITRKACITDPKKLQELFVDKGDTCSVTTAFARSGRISDAYQCNRPGKGMVMPTVNGNYTADTFDAAVDTETYFSGTGDYRMRQMVKAKRIGDCTAEAPAAS